MSTLLLRLAAPMQSWGADAKFDRRGTERTPTKSGVIGLAAAALGRRRNQSIKDLCGLRFGVRVDHEGILLRDFHTAHNAASAYVTNRYYLLDAVFLAGLEGNETLLQQIDDALRSPMFPLFLGRRSCPPEGRVSLGLRPGLPLAEALEQEPWLLEDWRQKKPSSPANLRIVTDAEETDGNAYLQRDVPLSFDQSHRKFGFRRVNEHGIAQKEPIALAGQPTQHNAFGELDVGESQEG